MNNRLVLSINILLLLGVIGLYYLNLSSHSKLVYVNSAQLINQYQGMIDARQEYQKKSIAWKSNVDTLGAEVQKAIQDFEKESSRLSKREKELSQELIKTKQEQLISYQKAIQEQAQQEDLAMTQAVISEINNYLAEYGQEHSYQIILAATDAGNIAYAQESIDITQEVLTGLNNRYQGIQ